MPGEADLRYSGGRRSGRTPRPLRPPAPASTLVRYVRRPDSPGLKRPLWVLFPSQNPSPVRARPHDKVNCAANAGVAGMARLAVNDDSKRPHNGTAPTSRSPTGPRRRSASRAIVRGPTLLSRLTSSLTSRASLASGRAQRKPPRTLPVGTLQAASSPRPVVAAVPCLAVWRGKSFARPPVRAGLHRNTVVGLAPRALAEPGAAYSEPLRFSEAKSAKPAATDADPQLASASNNLGVLWAGPVLAADAFWR